MFVKKFDEVGFLILLLYVENMLIVGRDPKNIESLKKALSKSFAMKDMGPAKQILGMHIVRDRTKKLMWLSQEKYVTKVLSKVQRVGCKTSQVNTTDQLQALWEEKPKDKGGQS